VVDGLHDIHIDILLVFPLHILLIYFIKHLIALVSNIESVVYTGIFFVQQIQLRTEGRENGDLGAVAPSTGFNSIL
jgi:hypothetical protein